MALSIIGSSCSILGDMSGRLTVLVDTTRIETGVVTEQSALGAICLLCLFAAVTFS